LRISAGYHSADEAAYSQLKLSWMRLGDLEKEKADQLQREQQEKSK
jgi:hypothetical protein